VQQFNAETPPGNRQTFKPGNALPHCTTNWRHVMLNVDKLAKRLRNWNRYRTTVRELSQLSDRDLSDLGISRGDIRFIAKKHAR
jgi:uncharacterized protein YjiS (DUF1127 family)